MAPESARLAGRTRLLQETATWRSAPEKWAAAQAILHVMRSDCQQIHTAERKECLVDVGPFVVPDAQTTKLIQPSEGSHDDPLHRP